MKMFDRLVAQCGLSALFARRSMERACVRAGIEPTALTAGNLPRVLPHVEEILNIYLAEDETKERIATLRKLS